MKKKVILLSLILVIFAAFFIQIPQQKTITIKGSFFNVYRVLVNPAKWEQWRPDLRKAFDADSNKFSIKKDTGSFTIKYADLELNVKSGDSFIINEHSDNGNSSYSYVVMPDKTLNKTLITAYKKISAINYLIGKFRPVSFSDTHITDLKNFMETDSLFYGCRILKTKVPESNLIVIDRLVLTKDKFSEAAKMLSTLQQYLKTHNVKQMQPLIAQFLTKGKDSAQLKVGIFINKKVNSENEITYNRMPKNGTFYVAGFRGRFNERQKVNLGLQQYFTDHLYQAALLPFETYLDNKLPASDTDRINIQVIFPSYF